MVKATKNRRNLFLFFKILLLIAVAFMCYFQFSKLSLDQSLEDIQFTVYPFLGMVLLLPLNYFFEWKKWRAVLNTVDMNFGSKTNVQAFFAGIITGMLTPNMQGNFIGRMYYYPRKYRLTLILLTLWTNIAQFLIALVFGLISWSCIGLSIYKDIDDRFSLLLGILIIGVAIIYFTAEKWKLGFNKFKFVKRFKAIISKHPLFRIEVLLWGILRYIIFSIQFFLALVAFGGDATIELFLLVWQIYLWSTIAPSLILGKLLVRESIAIWVLAGIGIGDLNIIFASLSIWIVNLLFPTLLGIVICQKRTLEK